MARDHALRWVTGALAALALGACGGSASTPSSGSTPVTGCRPVSELARIVVHPDGPLAGLASGGAAFADVRHLGQRVRFEGLPISLDISGDGDIVIDHVSLEPFDAAVPVPSVTRVEAVAPPGRTVDRDALCQPIAPGHDRQLLVLTVRTSAPLAMNKSTQVLYHTADGTEYDAIFDLSFPLCGPEWHGQRCVQEYDRLRHPS